MLYRTYHNLRAGLQNLYRWLPLVWADRNSDEATLLAILEYKFEHMSTTLAHGYGKNRGRHAKQLRICAHLCKRLYNNNYDENASKAFPRARHWVQEAIGVQRNDQALLGKIIGRSLTSWWD